MAKKLTNKEFIEKARKIHDYKYDYSKVIYIDMRTKVCIICPIHGEFWQTPTNHLTGRGCPKCAGKNISQEEWIKKVKEIHKDNNYDYYKVLYINAKTPVCIICPIHGEFWQTPNNHLTGYGCHFCGKNNFKKPNKTNEEFIKQAKEIHGDDEYDYSETDYKNSDTKVLIKHNKCGKKFWMSPSNHTHKTKPQGCKNCANEIIYNSRRKSNEEFINQAKKIHKDNNYDYSETDYKNSDTKVSVICKKHGVFKVTPYHHLKGSGCPKCNASSKPENECHQHLIQLYGESNVKRNWDKDSRYPFYVDFYIIPEDLFIECNFHWTHGKEYYSPRIKEHKQLLTEWKNKNTKYYNGAINTWTVRDPLKFKTAKENNLNYLVFYNKDDFKNHFNYL